MFSIKPSPLCISLISFTIYALVESAAVQQLTPGSGLPNLRVRQSNGTYTPVTGCKGGVVDRREINELQASSPDVFNMYLLALDDLQDDMENEDSSWYQVSGIHGYPYVSWQEDPDFVPATPGRGYCTHRSSIFTTWHRPYLLLLEQLVCEKARSLAEAAGGSYGAQRWKDAAEQVRLPYWDWSASGSDSRIPPAAKTDTITVEGPNGTRTIDNPLFDYDFLNPQPSDSGLGTETIRGSSDDRLADGFQNRRLATLNLFTVGDYNQFSGDLESIHDSVHVGVGGDMGFVPRSAFDPIFFLHHANVDRLMAMYQATHPGVALTPRSRSPTFALGGPGPDTLDTRLYPFRHPDLGGWTSNDVATAESIFTYGYSYPEVPQGLGQQALSDFTTERVNALYAPQPEAPAQSRLFSSDSKSGVANAATSRLEWTCNVQVNTNGLVGSYRIQLYIGEEGSSQNAAGTAAIFADSDSAMEMPNDLVNASVPLTPTLIDKDISLSPNNTVPALKSQLSWVIQRSTGSGAEFTTVGPSELGSSFVISVVSYEANYPSDKSQLPTKGEPVTYYEPTAGKAGGLDQGEEVKVGSKVASVSNSTAPAATRMVRRMF